MAKYAARFVADSGAVDTEEFLDSCRAATRTAIDDLVGKGVIAACSDNENIMWRHRDEGMILVISYEVTLGEKYQHGRKYQHELTV